MPLTATEVLGAKPTAKARKLYDERGLFLLVNPNGGKWWRFKYRIDGKEKLISLGTYPDVGLKEARLRREEARKLVASGIDPSAQRKAQRAAKVGRSENSFEAVAREWFNKFAPGWAEGHSKKIIQRLDRDIFPWIGDQSISEIEPPDLLAVVRRIESRGALDTAHRALQNCGQIFRYAVATGRAQRDPSADLRGALPPAKPKHFAAITDPVELGKLLKAIQTYHGALATRCALKLLPYVFTRPGELRLAGWDEFDLDKAEWTIPAAKTKSRSTDLVVPLSCQAVDILLEIHPLSGRGQYVFPGARSPRRPMSGNALIAALRYLGYDKERMTPHGFRAAARTILDEVLGYRVDLIEHQLGHAVRDPLGRAYNRTKHLPERREMMQAWADYLEGLEKGADVAPIKSNLN